MDEKQREQLVCAVILALSRVELTRQDQIELLETTVERLRIMEEVDETALLQMVGMAN
jgi:hypothetical protein